MALQLHCIFSAHIEIIQDLILLLDNSVEIGQGYVLPHHNEQSEVWRQICEDLHEQMGPGWRLLIMKVENNEESSIIHGRAEGQLGGRSQRSGGGGRGSVAFFVCQQPDEVTSVMKWRWCDGCEELSTNCSQSDVQVWGRTNRRALQQFRVPQHQWKKGMNKYRFCFCEFLNEKFGAIHVTQGYPVWGSLRCIVTLHSSKTHNVTWFSYLWKSQEQVTHLCWTNVSCPHRRATQTDGMCLVQKLAVSSILRT